MLQLQTIAGECPGKPHFAEMLFAWGRRLSEAGATGGLAYRFALGFVCTARGVDLGALSAKDLLFLEPKEPGGEAWMSRGRGEVPGVWWIHATVFANRGSAIFTGLMEGTVWAEAALRAGAPPASGVGAGPGAAVIGAIEAALGKGNLVSLEGVGALALGSTADDAGLALLESRSRA